MIYIIKKNALPLGFILFVFMATAESGCILPTDIALQGDYAYRVDGGLFQVYDISKANQPKLIAELKHKWWSTSVEAAGKFAYVLGHKHLRVMDVSVPTHPRFQASLKCGKASDIKIDGQYLYLLQDSGRVSLYQLGKDSPPAFISAFHGRAPQIRANCFSVDNGYIYIGYDIELIAVDYRNIHGPVEAGRLKNISVERMVKQGDYLFAHAEHWYGNYQGDFDPANKEYSSLYVINISDPSFPVLTHPMPFTIPRGGVSAWNKNPACSRNRLFLLGEHMVVVNISNPIHPKADRPVVIDTNRDNVWQEMVIRGNIGLVSLWRKGIRALDLSEFVTEQEPSNTSRIPGYGGFRLVPGGIAVKRPEKASYFIASAAIIDGQGRCIWRTQGSRGSSTETVFSWRNWQSSPGRYFLVLKRGPELIFKKPVYIQK